MYQELIDQLSYHTDELDGLLTGFGLLPDHLIEESPDATEPAILQVLEDAVSTEVDRVLLLSFQPAAESEADLSWPELINRWKQIRVGMLAQLDDWTPAQFEQSVDGRPVHDILRDFVIQDTDRLRSIGERILSSGWGMRA